MSFTVVVSEGEIDGEPDSKESIISNNYKVGDEHIDDWNVWCVKDVGFGFDEENHKPVKVVCTSNLEEFDCGISFRGLNVIEKSEYQQQKYIDNQGEQQ